LPDFEIICLANSRKPAGRCIAGLRTNGDGWIRPVTTEGALKRRNYTLDNNTNPMVLDILRVNLRVSLPKPYQPENWLVGAKPWRLVFRPAPYKYGLLLNKYIEVGPELFGDTSDRIKVESFTEVPARASLTLIVPIKLRWQITTSFRGNRQTRAWFVLNGVYYDLVVTDSLWEDKLRSFSEGVYSSEQIGLEQEKKVLFTISLGGPLVGECFKLVAAVIILPPSWD